MNTLEFAKDIPAEKLAEIFRDYFEQHMFAYNLLRGVNFVSLNNVSFDKASIIYSVKVLNDEDKDKLVNNLISKSGSLNIYGKLYRPEIYLNGDLLCITIKK